MKKFLDLKQGIVQSKNQPSLMQVYLESIRSSCYKIKAPCLQTKTINQFVNGMEENREVGSTIKIKNIDKYYLDSELTPLEKGDKQMGGQIDMKFEEIFKQLERGGLNSGQKIESNEKIILNTIIQKLNVLEENKSLVGSIQLIKKIIYSMPCYQHLQTLQTLHSHMGSPINYHNIYQSIREEEECVGIQRSEYSENTYKKYNYQYDSIVMDNENDEEIQAITEYQTQNKINNSCSSIPQPHQIKYKVYSIHEEEEQYPEEYLQQQLSPSLDNTMQSQDLRRWDQLQRITERESEQENSSIREESMEFKKILYMLQSTQKKSRQGQNCKEKYKQMTRVKTVESQSSRKSEKESVVVSCRMSRTGKVRQSNCKEDKSKTIKDIVKLLNNKYHRKVNFIR